MIRVLFLFHRMTNPNPNKEREKHHGATKNRNWLSMNFSKVRFINNIELLEIAITIGVIIKLINIVITMSNNVSIRSPSIDIFLILAPYIFIC